MDTRDDVDSAVGTLARELAAVREMGGCSGCRNCLAIVEQARADLIAIDSETARVAALELERWLDDAAGRTAVTSDCEVCVPTGPYQRFRDALAAAADSAS